MKSWAVTLLALGTLFIAAPEALSQCYYGWGSIYTSSPSSGDEYTRNTTMTINWYANTTVGNYGGTHMIEYSTDGQRSWKTIATGVDGYAQSYNWLIPADETPGSDWYIRVSDESIVGWGCVFNYPGISGPFTVLKGCFLQQSVQRLQAVLSA
ncbi:MAG: hypothetical protein IPP80_05925 [Ignavibacteria bacterium]|nr:hypothetical protein [Ignavibacteria bacterium]